MSDRGFILAWAEDGRIGDACRALAAAGVTPGPREWRDFVDRLLLWTGAAALAAGVVFFIAYNWDALGKFVRFGALEALIAAAVLAYWKLGPDRGPGKAALLVACILTGALLALFGQTYQTGADTWELFATWAALIAPWVLIGRFAALWIVWLVIANTGLALYFTVFGGLFRMAFATEHQLWTIFVFNTAALAAWEIAARRVTWLDERWAARLIAIASGTLVTLLILHEIFEWRDASGVALVAYPAWLAGAYLAYRRWQRDLFVLAGGCLSLIVVVTTFLTKQLLSAHVESASFLMIALVVIGMAGAAGWWLRQIAREGPA